MTQPATTRELIVRAAGVELPGTLTVPADALGTVIFAHGSGSGRLSPRNRSVADHLNGIGLATLLFDLLTEAENRIDERTGALRFDIERLSARLTAALDWLAAQPIEVLAAASRHWALFGASTGAAAALVTAAQRPAKVVAVVSRGGRPDLAERQLHRVQAPTLLIVGEYDRAVIRLNEHAAQQLRCPHRLTLVPGATHLFEEPGTLAQVAQLAGDWFLAHLHGAAR